MTQLQGCNKVSTAIQLNEKTNYLSMVCAFRSEVDFTFVICNICILPTEHRQDTSAGIKI